MTMINHLLLTTRFLMLGALRTGGRRLRQVLTSEGPAYLVLEQAVLWELHGPRKIEAGRIMVRWDQVVFAHEYVDLVGDPDAQRLAVEEEGQAVSALLTNPPGWELAGRVPALEVQPSRSEAFLVMRDPELRASPLSGAAAAEAKRLESLSYLIVNRNHIHCLLSHE